MANLVAFVGDSRGRGLQKYLSVRNPFPDNCNFYVRFIPGGTLIDMHNHIQQFLSAPRTQAHHNIIITIFADICNLTTKHGTNKHGRPIYDNCNYCTLPFTSITYITSHKQQFLHDIAYIHSNIQHYPNTFVKFAPIAPAHLLKYTQHFCNKEHNTDITSFNNISPDILTQQKQLETDIIEINQYISQLNTANLVRTVRLDRDISRQLTMKRGRKGQNTKEVTKFVYGNAPDGVHVNNRISNKWFKALAKSASSDVLQPLTHIPVDILHHEEEEEDDHEEEVV